MTLASNLSKIALVAGMTLIAPLAGPVRANDGAASVSAMVTPVADGALVAPPPGDWLMWRRTYNSWNYSPLSDITAGNIGGLTLAWSRAMEGGAQEVAPIIRDGVMFVPEPGGEIVRAIDGTTGDLLWEYTRKLPKEVNYLSRRLRNLAIYGDNIYFATGDAHVVAINARTGAQVWDTEIKDWRTGALHSSGPIVVKGKLILPQTCLPYRPDGKKAEADCAITAVDARTGAILWTRPTIATPDDPNDKSWGGVPPDARWPASTWLPGSYDPDLDLLYWGTASSRPYPSILKGTGEAELLYTNTTLALRPADGGIAWFFQHHPKDEFDIDYPFERLIVDTDVAPDPKSVPWINPALRKGQSHKVLTGIFGKDGYVWTLDRKTGRFLWARPTTYQNIYTGFDARAGRPIENKTIRNVKVGVASLVCPYPAGGGKNWPTGAYSPDMQVMFMPLGNACSDATMTAAPQDGEEFGPGSGGRQIYAPKLQPDGEKNIGRIDAVSASTGRTLWTYSQRAPVMSILAVGKLLFFGDTNRRFKALDQATGKIVWETILGGSVSGFPVAYRKDGREYIAVATGGGTTLDTMTKVLTPEINMRSSGNALYVFALPQAAGR